MNVYFNISATMDGASFIVAFVFGIFALRLVFVLTIAVIFVIVTETAIVELKRTNNKKLCK